MNKTILYHLLAFLLLFGISTTTEAQVTIGAGLRPLKGSILDLKQFENADTKLGKANATGGLMLPRVDLEDITNLKPMVDISPLEMLAYTGMLVYNVKEDIPNGLCAGIYIWRGDQWERLPDGCTLTLVSSITVPDKTVEVSSTVTAVADILPLNASNKGVSWSLSSGSAFASFNTSTGQVTGLSPGTATITALALDGSGITGTGNIHVIAARVPVTGITVPPLSVEVSKTNQATATITPGTATDQTVTWEVVSGNTFISIHPTTGVVTGLAVGGPATIRATANDGSNVTNTGTVNVVAQTIPVGTITVDDISMDIGTARQAAWAVLPSNATNKAVIWSVIMGSDKVSIDANGVISGNALGTATIQALSQDGSGILGTATVTVNPVSVTSVSVSPTSASIAVNGTRSLTATVNPSNATDKTVSWESSNTSVATVSSTGVVTGKTGGTAIITVRTADGNKTATCNITVTVPVTSVSMSPTSASIAVNGTRSLTATVNPSNATDKTVSWESSNTSVATVSSTGVVTGKTGGTAIITVRTADGNKTATCNITVTVPVTSVSMSPTSASIAVNGTRSLTATVNPSNATDKTVSWESSNTSVATVSSTGVVTGKTGGTAIITVRTADGNKTATCNITVTVPVTSVSMSPTSASIAVNGTRSLTATVNPSNATDKTVSWESSNTSVATVSSTGVVTGKSGGTATITVTTTDGRKTANCLVTVTVPVTGVTVSPTSKSMVVGETVQAVPTVAPSDATNKTVSWSSSNPSAATVSSSGLITAIGVGTSTVTVTTQEGNRTATVTVNVTPVLVSGITVNVPANVNIGQKITATAAVLPNNAAEKGVTWSISPTSIATINASTGEITGVAVGSATITATAKDTSGKTGTGTVTVKPVLVESISIAFDGNIVNVDETKQATVTSVLPANATDKTVGWSIVSGAEYASIITSTGYVTGKAEGTVTIKATANDGSGILATLTISVKVVCGKNGVANTLKVGANSYLVHEYGNDCWMVTNSKEGAPSHTKYSGQAEGARGYYYEWKNSATACPAGWVLPTIEQFDVVRLQVNAALTAAESKWWAGSQATSNNVFAGVYNSNNLPGSEWSGWNDSGSWMTTTMNRVFSGYTSKMLLGTGAETVHRTVRCIRPL